MTTNDADLLRQSLVRKTDKLNGLPIFLASVSAVRIATGKKSGAVDKMSLGDLQFWNDWADKWIANNGEWAKLMLALLEERTAIRLREGNVVKYSPESERRLAEINESVVKLVERIGWY